MSEEDLSNGAVRATDAIGIDYRLELDKQKLKHRRAIFYVLLVCGVALVACFIAFGAFVVSAILASKLDALSWPLFAMGSVTLLSGVTLLFSIARFTYRHEGIDDGKADAFPPAEAIGKVVELVRLAAGKGQD